MNMSKEKVEETLPDRKVSPFRHDGIKDFGPQGGRTATEIRQEETADNNRRAIVGEGLYSSDHPGY